jgi:hypothetical protein
LHRVNLREANLSEANLYGTCLDPTCPVFIISDTELARAGLEARGNFVYGWRTMQSPIVGSHVYTPGLHTAPVFSIDRYTDCHPGIYLAGAGWLDRQDYSRRPRVRCYCRRDELVHAGDKWRCRRLWVLPEGHTYTKEGAEEYGEVEL